MEVSNELRFSNNGVYVDNVEANWISDLMDRLALLVQL